MGKIYRFEIEREQDDFDEFDCLSDLFPNVKPIDEDDDWEKRAEGFKSFLKHFFPGDYDYDSVISDNKPQMMNFECQKRMREIGEMLQSIFPDATIEIIPNVNYEHAELGGGYFKTTSGSVGVTLDGFELKGKIDRMLFGSAFVSCGWNAEFSIDINNRLKIDFEFKDANRIIGG